MAKKDKKSVIDREGNDHSYCSAGYCKIVRTSSILCPKSGPTGHDCNY